MARRVKLCKDTGCNNTATTDGFCRVHYLKNWKKIKSKQKKKAVESLNRYIDHVMKSNPEGYMEAIRDDLKNRDFMSSKADHFSSDDEFHDVLDELGNEEVNRIIGSIKVDDSF